MNVFENRTYKANRKNTVGTLSTMNHVQMEGLPTPYTFQRSSVYLRLRRIPPEVREQLLVDAKNTATNIKSRRYN
jgi:hypothetical protein